jgi:Zn-dependent protease
MDQQLLQTLYAASTWIIPVLLAVTLHEAAHGFAARYLGDDTAWRLGRVTLNPFAHIDAFGTILLPAFLLLVRSPFLFGYAKPVPVKGPAPRASDPPLLDRKRILLVHPDAGILCWIASALEKEGAEVVVPKLNFDDVLACADRFALDGAVLRAARSRGFGACR